MNIWTNYIKNFRSYLKIERGLSSHTIENYTFDLKRLIDYLQRHEIDTNPKIVSEEIIQGFIYEISQDVNPRTQSRIISGLKSFFSWMIFEDMRSDNPMDLIESPRSGRKLPDTLEISDIDNLIAAIDLSSAEGERNRAMLETLYGCGLRVSELVNLQISDLFFDEGFIKIT